MDKPIVVKRGFKFTTVLFIIFLILKLTGAITWSWWWVTIPLWGGHAFILLVLLLILGIGLLGAILGK